MRNSILAILIFLVCTSFAQKNTKMDASVILVSQNNNSITLKMKAPAFSLKQVNNGGKTYDKLFLRGAVHTLEAGMPEVMSLSKSIIIPNLGSSYLEVVSSSYTDVQNINLIPSKGNIMRNIDPSTVSFKEGPQYNKNEFFPSGQANLGDPYIFGQVRGQAVNFSPFQYNPVTKTLRVYDEIIVKISYNTLPGVNELLNTSNQVLDNEFSKIYQSHFINYQSNKYTQLQENGNMIIISDPSFITAMMPLVNWKNRSGRRTEIFNVQTIGNNSTAIKAFIQNYYNTKGLTYVLLVGDNAQVTPKMLTASTASDNFYGYLTGSDSYPEVFVGRFSAETVAHVQTQVARTVDYETFNNVISNYFANGIGIASEEGPGDDNEYDFQHVRNMRTDLLNYNYTAMSELYEGSQGGQDLAGNPSASMVTGELNDGKGILLYTGHGSSTSFGTTGFSSTNVAALNNVGKLPFIWAVACVNGEFVNQTCFAEKWLRSTNSQGQAVGAVATLMSTINQSWNPPMDGQDEMVDLLVESYTNNIKRTFGGLSMNGCMHMNDQYGTGGSDMTDTWTIFGDPSLMVRTATPNQIYASHNPTINVGDSTLLLYVSHNDVLVAISRNDSLIATATPTNMIVNLNFSPITAVDTFDLVITGYNLIPYQAYITSTTTLSPYVTQDQLKVADSQTNANSMLDNGETTFISCRLKNLGQIGATSVSAKLKSNSPYITILDSTEIFGNFLPGDTITISNAFQVSVSQNIPDQTQIAFSLIVSDTIGNIWSSNFSFVANAPIIDIISAEITEVNGNSDGKIDAGEILELALTVKNTGHNKVDNSTASVTCPTALATNISPAQNISSLKQDSVKTLDFSFQVSNTAIAGDRINLIAKVLNGNLGDSLTKSVLVGIFDENFETSDFTKFNWVNTSSKPWVIDNSEYYEGGNSARSGLQPGDDNQTTILQLDLNVAFNDSISYFMKISSEDGTAYGQYWDFLEFFIDANSKGKWQGEIGWKRYSYPIQAGNRSLYWVYQKDQIETAGSDCAWIDFIVFPPLVDNSAVGQSNILSGFNIYPNPAVNKLNFSINSTIETTGNLMVMSLDGKVAINGEQLNVRLGMNTFSIDLYNLAKGVYNVSFVTDSQVITRRIVKF